MATARRCPECGSTVSPFAAGCAICGADLEVHRAGQRSRPTLPALSRPSLGSAGRDLIVVTIVMVLLALYFPLYGTLLAAYVLWQSHRSGQDATRNAAIVCLALAVLDLVAPSVLLARIGL
jgi:hypothetical protein